MRPPLPLALVQVGTATRVLPAQHSKLPCLEPPAPLSLRSRTLAACLQCRMVRLVR